MTLFLVVAIFTCGCYYETFHLLGPDIVVVFPNSGMVAFLGSITVHDIGTSLRTAQNWSHFQGGCLTEVVV